MDTDTLVTYVYQPKKVNATSSNSSLTNDAKALLGFLFDAQSYWENRRSVSNEGDEDYIECTKQIEKIHLLSKKIRSIKTLKIRSV